MELDSCLTAPANWQRRTISAVCERFTSGGTPSRARPEFYGGHIPWVKTKELGDRTLWGAEECITEAGLAGSSAKLLPAGTVLMAMYGATVAKLGRLGMPMACNQACAAMVVDSDLADASYLFFQLKLNRTKIVSSASGAAQQNLSGQQIKNFILPFPEVGEQRLIGGLLGSLDEKIELNRRMNETLEAMAQAIFRDWFVDFGPVRRKMEGATDPVAIMGGLTPDPARATELAALFPVGFGGDGLPDGWDGEPLSKQLDIIGGGTPKTTNADYWDGPIPWFSVADTPAGRDVFVFDTEKSITERGLAESAARLVAPGTTIISARGTVGNLAVAANPMTFNQSCYALRSSRGEHPGFVYLCAARAVEQLRAMAHGSVFSTITRQTFNALSFTCPPIEILEAFELTISPLFDRIKASVAESRTLAETRDYLLPRLMSGAVKVGAVATDPRNDIDAA